MSEKEEVPLRVSWDIRDDFGFFGVSTSREETKERLNRLRSRGLFPGELKVVEIREFDVTKRFLKE